MRRANPVACLLAIVFSLAAAEGGAEAIYACVPPDHAILIYTATKTADANRYAVLHFLDPNEPSQVTGYHVYRSSSSSLAYASWPRVAFNYVDTATPNKQWVDDSGAVPPGGIWYYLITAYNDSCAAEGPYYMQVVVSPTTVAITEGASDTFGVALGYVPTANTTVTLTSNNTAVATVSPSTLTFTPANYNVSQPVTVTAQQDVDLIAGSTTVSATATGAAPGTATVNVADDDTQDITVVEDLTNIGEGSSGTFTVRLAFQPIANTTVGVSSNDSTALSVSPASLTFTPANYSTPQTVTISGVADVDLVHETVTITVASAPLPTKTFTLRQYDNDLLHDPPNQSGPCFTSDTFSMNLDAVPLENVVVTPTPNGGTAGDATVTPSSRTFTTANWAASQTFTVTYGKPGTTNVELSAPGQTTRTMVVTSIDVGCE